MALTKRLALAPCSYRPFFFFLFLLVTDYVILRRLVLQWNCRYLSTQPAAAAAAPPQKVHQRK